MTRDAARARDEIDPLRLMREQFSLPEGVIYLDGNSLGPMPKRAAHRLTSASGEWSQRLIRGWNEGWMDAPRRIGAKIASIIGAWPDEVIVSDSTSVNLFKLLVAALRIHPERRTVVTEAGNFPTDLHIAEGVIGCVPGASLKTVARGEINNALGNDTAALLLTQVHYKTGERYDLKALTAAAHAVGAVAIWDLSHSAGAVEVDLAAARVDLAVGCAYKYLNGGPGAPAYLFIARRWQEQLRNPLSGWMGHAAPFSFIDAYEPAHGMPRWLAGTPQILSLLAMEAGVDMWREMEQKAVWAKSAALFEIMAGAGDEIGLECVTPRDAKARGSHISFRHPHAYAICQALIAREVIGDFREPDILRFGLTPLYLSHEEVWRAGEILTEVMKTEAWRDAKYAERRLVT